MGEGSSAMMEDFQSRRLCCAQNLGWKMFILNDLDRTVGRCKLDPEGTAHVSVLCIVNYICGFPGQEGQLKPEGMNTCILCIGNVGQINWSGIGRLGGGGGGSEICRGLVGRVIG